MFEVAQLLKHLKSYYPSEYVAISIDYAISKYTHELQIEYNLYVSNYESMTFETLRELRAYVYKITDTLTVSQLLNQAS